MAKAVFRPNEVSKTDGEVMLKLTKEFAPPVEEVEEEVPEYTGPTADDLRREAEEFKAKWEIEKADMIAQAKASADEIIKNAEEAAFAEVKRQTDQAAVIKTSAEKNAADVVQKAEQEAAQILSKAHEEEQELFAKAKKEGYDSGHEEGYRFGSAEADRLVERLHAMVEAVQGKRQEILDFTEQQIVELVLLMTRKVVKVLSESQKSVIVSNVVQALKKVKGRGDITLRVNLADVKLTTEHTKDFIREVENIKNITVVEDGSVEKGGCIVETDFGAIDARISSQLSTLEAKIMEVAPIKTVNKASVAPSDA